MRQYPCTLQEKMIELNSYDEPIGIGFEDISQIVVDIQPLSGSRVRELPGVTEKSTHRLFTMAELKVGNYILQGNKRYLIEYVQDWLDHREAILEELLEGRELP